MIQHIVLFTPKAELSVEQRRAFARTTIDTLLHSVEVERFTVGRRVIVDAGYERSFGDKTYDYAAVLQFKNKAALVSYLNSPGHSELGRMFWEACEGSVIVEVEVDAPDDGDADKLV